MKAIMDSNIFMSLIVGGSVFCIVGLSAHLAIFFGLLKERYQTRSGMVAAYKADAKKENDFVFGTYQRAHRMQFVLCYGGWILGLGMLAAAALIPVA